MLLGSSTGGMPGSGPAKSDDAALDGGRLVVAPWEAVAAPVDAPPVEEVADDGAVDDGDAFAAGWRDVQPANSKATASKLTAAVRGRAFITGRLSSRVLAVCLRACGVRSYDAMSAVTVTAAKPLDLRPSRMRGIASTVPACPRCSDTIEPGRTAASTREATRDAPGSV